VTRLFTVTPRTSAGATSVEIHTINEIECIRF
jgi:hypothetical protein